MPAIGNRYETISSAAYLAWLLRISIALGSAAVWAQSQAVEEREGISNGQSVQIESALAAAEREVVLRLLLDRVDQQILDAVELACDVNFAYHTIRTIPTPPGSWRKKQMTRK